MFIFSLVDHTSSSGSSSRASEPWNRTLSLVSISLFHLDQEKAMADDRRAICSYIQFVTMEFYQGETKKKLDRPLPRWILCKYNRNHDQKVQRFLFFTHIYWKYFDYINHVFSKQKFYEIINVGLALFLTLFWMLTYLEESSAGNKLMPASFMIWEIIVNTLVKLNSQLLKVLKIGKKDL